MIILIIRPITIKILQLMAILDDRPLLEMLYLNKYLIPTKHNSGRSSSDLSNVPDLAEMLIVKYSIIKFHDVHFKEALAIG